MSAPAGEPLGGPAEEARRLVEALGDWAAIRLGTAQEHLANGSAECRLCPVCQVIAALRGDRSEVLARVGAAWTAFLGVLSDQPIPPTAGSPPDQPSAGTDAGTDAGPDPAQPIRPVQNIDVR